MVLFSRKFKNWLEERQPWLKQLEEFCARIGRIHGNSSIVSEKWGVRPMKEW